MAKESNPLPIPVAAAIPELRVNKTVDGDGFRLYDCVN
jgi:hypothetical protein